MFNFFNKNDSDVKRDVMHEMLWDPSVTDKDVVVTAKNGIVTLRGTVPHYIEKVAAEHAAQRVGGVRAVADELEVKGIFDKTDEEIATAALNALKWNYSVPDDIQVSVEKGWITVSGVADWHFQRNAVTDAVKNLMGVVGVTNSMTLKNKPGIADIKICIQDALNRAAESEGRNIDVAIDGDNVTLTGKVHSCSESEDAKFAAWNAPGVMTVTNNLKIEQ